MSKQNEWPTAEDFRNWVPHIDTHHHIEFTTAERVCMVVMPLVIYIGAAIILTALLLFIIALLKRYAGIDVEQEWLALWR